MLAYAWFENPLGLLGLAFAIWMFIAGWSYTRSSIDLPDDGPPVFFFGSIQPWVPVREIRLEAGTYRAKQESNSGGGVTVEGLEIFTDGPRRRGGRVVLVSKAFRRRDWRVIREAVLAGARPDQDEGPTRQGRRSK